MKAEGDVSDLFRMVLNIKSPLDMHEEVKRRKSRNGYIRIAGISKLSKLRARITRV
ncbi:MAG: hypothetical protein KAU16_08445 [Methanophagales archaeon]|nr:hypothetical protein [Methanophagales archaeon]